MTQSSLLARYFPWIVATLAALLVLAFAAPSRAPDGHPALQEFGRLPVVEGGRVKPLDTVARNMMMAVSAQQNYKDAAGKSQPAVRWFLDAMVSGKFFDEQPAHSAPVFRIANEEVLSLLGLKPREGFRYSLAEIGPKIDKLAELASRARQKDPKARALVDNKAVELAEGVQRYIQVAELEVPLVLPPATAQGEDWRSLLDGMSEWPQLVQALKAEASRNGPEATGAVLARALDAARADGAPPPQDTADYLAVLEAYSRGDAGSFNQKLASLHERLRAERPADVGQADFESFFNRFQPFLLCMVLYILAAVLTAASWLVWSEPLRRAAFWLCVLTLALHTWALIARMIISGRPPVTNLYSSAVFIGWACVLLGILLERLYGMSLGNLVASVCGFATTLIAHNLAAAGSDTLGVMQAVLDTNFWLATHVTTITLGYAATFVAGMLGVVLIIRGVCTRSLTRDQFRALGQAIYGVVCLATLLSFVGTVLGGIWADQSWGRFWGWDTKENGALMIVLMNALILHARWAGMVQQRGMAALAVVGNIVTAWSWFGVNMLGVGLHSYGFMEGAGFWLVMFWLSQLILVGAALLPLERWRSYDLLRTDRPPTGPRAVPTRPRRGAPTAPVPTR